MTKAAALAAKPTKAVKDLLEEVKRLAESGGSEARADLEHEDGSVLIVACRAGEEPRVEVVEPAAE